MSRSAIEMSHSVVNYCIDHNIPISNLKLQKLLYYIQAAFLINGREAFSDEIYPWRYGPVVADVYQAFKMYVNRNIEDRFMDVYLDKKESEIADRVIESYRNYSPLQMVNKTHVEGPWRNAYANKDSIITKDAIRDYYNRHEELLYGN